MTSPGFTPTPSSSRGKDRPTRRTFKLALRGRSRSGALAVALLGSDHPLVKASDLLRSLIRQCAVVSAVLLAATMLCVAGQMWAWALIFAAVIVLTILTLLAAGFRQCTHDRAIDLILRGCENVPIAAIQHERGRLLSRRTRMRLARHISETVAEVSKRPTWNAREVVLFHPPTIASALDDLLAVADALTASHVPAQGVARAERLMTDGTSPFYDHDAIVLRAELRRIRHDLLAG
jgi:hypothetical protein